VKRFILVTALALLLALCFVVPAAAPASADVSGPCQLKVNGQDVGSLRRRRSHPKQAASASLKP
jgi:hypothetical protein